MKFLPIGFVLLSAAFGQSFDVASIKPAPSAGGLTKRFGGTGGPGTKDPGLFTCESCTLSVLLIEAYDIKHYQLSGPEAINIDMFDVSARIPEGATKEQFRLMLQNLLAERFKLAVHHEKKEMPVYDLVIAKGGPRLKAAAPVDPDAPLPPMPSGFIQKMELDKDGFPALPRIPGRAVSFIMNGRARTQASGATMEEIANSLTNQVGGKPVTDATGLKGRFDYTLTFAPDMAMMSGRMPPPPGGGPVGPPPASEAADPLPNIFAAVQEQLGLKLVPKRGMVDIVVVDHVEKTPTEN